MAEELPAAQRRALRRITAQLAELGPALPGSLIERRTRCGRVGCGCMADPPQLHGPYLQWTRKQDGKTVTRLLSPDQADRYRPWLEAARRLRELVRDLEALSVHAAEASEGWTAPQRHPPEAAKPAPGKGPRRPR
jgi:hypothetical protein